MLAVIRRYLFCLVIIGSLFLSACGSINSGQKNVPPLDTLLSSEDTRMADDAARYALEKFISGKKWQWSNPRTGNSGEVVPRNTWFVEERSQYCRSYDEVINVGSRSQRYHDVACRNQHGIWVAYR